MPEAQITKTVIVVVDTVGKNTYQDLVFTDKEGASYKISNKRVRYFDKTIVPNEAVELSYAMSSFGKEYIYSAKPVKDGLPPPQPIPETGKDVHKKPDHIQESIRENMEWKNSNIEKNVWWKEAGENFRSGLFDKTSTAPNGRALYLAYCAQMFASLSITVDKEVH